jgi:HK97 family phage prohead protease
MTKQLELVRRALVPEVRSVNEAKRQITFTSSDESVDRYGDILKVSGWQFSNYLKNPVVLWAHRSNEPPIGRCIEIHTESNPPALVQTIEFADEATYPFAATIFSLYKGGFLRAVSVGFLPLEAPTRIPDGDGYEYGSMELLELSCVPVPANPQALARAVEKGFDAAHLEKVFSGEAPPLPEAVVLRGLVEINSALAHLAVALAKAALLKANEMRALLEAAGVQSESADLTLEDLLAAVHGAGTSLPEVSAALRAMVSTGESIESVEQLGEVLGTTGIKEFEQALGLGGEADDGLERHPAGSRKWRDPGRIRKE